MRHAIEDTLSLLAGIGIGAGVMYLTDPVSGARRRRRIAETVEETVSGAGEAIAETTRRASGTLGEHGGHIRNHVEQIGQHLGGHAEQLRSAAMHAREFLPARWQQANLQRRATIGHYVVTPIGAISLLGFGVGMEYFFDPSRGRARRAFARDKTWSWLNHACEMSYRLGKHLSNRARGVAAQGRAKLRQDQPSDEQLSDRIRAAIGHISTGARNIEIHVLNGEVALHGKLGSENEINDLLRRARRVQGVRSLVCEITQSNLSPVNEAMQARHGINRTS